MVGHGSWQPAGFLRPSVGHTNTHVSGLIGPVLPSGQGAGTIFATGTGVGNIVGGRLGVEKGPRLGVLLGMPERTSDGKSDGSRDGW